MTKVLPIIFAIIGLLLVVGGGVLWFQQYYVNGPQYQRVIGDFALNAGDAPTLPEAGQWLQQFNDSMNQQGLTPDLYNSAFSWDQTPQNRMNFQYKYINDLIKIRLPYYEKLANSTTCGFNDCYNLAITNFRNELNHNGPADWVAQGAWMIKNGYFWIPYYAGIMFGVGLLFIGIGVASVIDWSEVGD